MRILIDTNVILDVLLKRSPFYETAIEVLKLSTRDDIQEFVSASAITDIYYIAYKNLRDKAAVRELLKKLLLIVSVAGVSEEEIQKAYDTLNDVLVNLFRDINSIEEKAIASQEYQDLTNNDKIGRAHV